MVDNVREITPKDEEVLSMLAPMRSLTTAENKSAKYICGKYHRGGTWFIDVFLIDISKGLYEQIEEIKSAGSGKIFNDLVFMYFIGEQPRGELSDEVRRYEDRRRG